MVDRTEKRFGKDKKPDEKVEAPKPTEAEASGSVKGDVPPDVKGLFDRLQKERQQTADRHDRERTQMHGRHAKDYKDLATRHEEEVQQVLNSGGGPQSGPGAAGGTPGL